MKNIIKISVLALLIINIITIYTSCNTAENNTVVVNDTLSHDNSINSDIKIEVYNFHRTNRCMTCNAIGVNSRKVVENYFLEENKKGIVTFKQINLDEEQNNQLAEKFEALGSSLYILTKVKDQETIENLTEFAFLTAVDQPDMLIEAIKTNVQEKLNQYYKKPNI